MATIDKHFLRTIAEALESIEKGECEYTILTDLFELQSVRVEDDIEVETSRTFFLFKLRDDVDEWVTARQVTQIKMAWELAWDLNNIDNWVRITPTAARKELMIVMVAHW